MAGNEELKEINQSENKEPSIADLEEDTKYIMDRQVREIKAQIEDIEKSINVKLEKLRLGVLQKTINKVITKSFDEQIDNITVGMQSRFSLQLRKVILEKFFATELSNLKENITKDMNRNEFDNAEIKWAKAKEIILQVQDDSVKLLWSVFENEYNLRKKYYNEDQKKIIAKLNEYRMQIDEYMQNSDFSNADGIWVIVKELLVSCFNSEVSADWSTFEADYFLNKEMFLEEQRKLETEIRECRYIIEEKVNKNDFASADAVWVKVKELLIILQDKAIIDTWNEFEGAYLYNKNAFKDAQIYIEERLDEMLKDLEQCLKDRNFNGDEEKWEDVKDILEGTEDPEVKAKWNDFEKHYFTHKQCYQNLEKSFNLNQKFAYNESIDLIANTINFIRNKGLNELRDELKAQLNKTIVQQDDYKKVLHLLLEYESKFEDNYSKDYLNASLDYANKIIVIAQRIDIEEKRQKYLKKKEQIEKRIEYQKQFQKQETTDLLEKASSISEFMSIEDGVLPIVDDFAITDLINNLSSDINVAMTQVASLLKEHRVKIKTELDSTVMLRSESGEIFEEQAVKEIAKSEDENQLDVIYTVQTGLLNPFEDSIEEAILTDMIPYNFEIMNVQVNGKVVDALPEKQLSKEGMILSWEFGDIPTREGVQVVYDLRRRISRTVLFYLNKELRIIKTHSKLTSTEMEGVYHTEMPFTNNYDKDIHGLIVEDVVPLYYNYFVKDPTTSQPNEITPSKNGDLLKWDIGNMPVGSQNFEYKLFELYRYEELKIKMSILSSNLIDSLNEGNLNDVVRKNSEIDDAVDLISN